MAFNSEDKKFLMLAGRISLFSKDPSTKVGVVIVNSDGDVVSTGVNSIPSKLSYEGLDKEIKLDITVHAEMSAIISARKSLVRSTMYITSPPCALSASIIAQTGIRRVVFLDPAQEQITRWKKSFALGLVVLAAEGVRVTRVNHSDLVKKGETK